MMIRLRVSIPYSTIKIFVTGKQFYQLLVFQFLIVRLKYVRGLGTTTDLLFQFLIVRLK